MCGSSTVEVTQYIIPCVDSQEQVDVLYTNFAKVFDTIDHADLISKLI